MNRFRLLPLPALQDNYIWLLADECSNAFVVDPGEAPPVLAALEREQLRLRAVLLTHHHPDHVGGVEQLCRDAQIEVFAPHDARIAHATQRIGEGDVVRIPAMDCSFGVIAVPGHTLSHVAYHGHDLLFSGDTLFSVGCGRLFEGTPRQMLDSLDRLAALPAGTQVCCGHEYTEANCAFALHLDPDNPALAARAVEARALRAASRPTVPALLADEIACNPFLRIDAPQIHRALASRVPHDADRYTCFAALRSMKDQFRA